MRLPRHLREAKPCGELKGIKNLGCWLFQRQEDAAARLPCRKLNVISII